MIYIGYNEFSKNFRGPKKLQKDERADVTLWWIVTKRLHGKEREKERERGVGERENLDIVLRVKNCA